MFAVDWKIQTSEFPKVFQSRCVVGTSGVCFQEETSQIFFPAVKTNIGHPRRPMRLNAFEIACGPRTPRSVPKVVGSGTVSKIFFSIIQTVPVSVVYVFTLARLHNFSMQQQHFPGPGGGTSRVKPAARRCLNRMPFNATNPLKVIEVNDRNQPSGQRKKHLNTHFFFPFVSNFR
jgi:hypothetical protein